MDAFWKAVEAVGGGLAGLVIVSLAFISWRLFIEMNRAKDDRLADAKESAKEQRELLESSLLVQSASEQTIREALHELRRR